MTRICHLLDGSSGWEQRVAVSQLLLRLPGDRFECRLASIEPVVPQGDPSGDQTLHRFHCAPGLALLSSPSLSKFVAKEGVDLVHAWGMRAVLAARVLEQSALVVELFDPNLREHEIKLLRTLAQTRRIAVVCASELVRRRVVEGGVPIDRCALIRPGVDFGLIGRYQRSDLRSQLGLKPKQALVIIPTLQSLGDDQLEALWAVEFIGHLGGDHRIMVPGSRRAGERMARFDRAGLDTQVAVWPHDSVPHEALVAIADAFVTVSAADTSTTDIAWAMAARTTVLAAASPAVTEMIVHKTNGLLFNPEHADSAAICMARLLLDRESHEPVREQATGQAYEVFGMRRHVDQHARLYDNLLEGQRPDDGIVDSAVVV